MKTLDEFDFGTQTRRSQYDWDEILNGEINVLEAGKDFECKPITIKSRARVVAKERGLACRVRETKNGDVVVQSYEPDESEKEFDEATKKEKPEKKPAAKKGTRRRRKAG